MEHLKAWYYIVKLVFGKILVYENSKDWRIIRNHSFGKSFRYSEKDASNPLFIFKHFLKSLKYPVTQITYILTDKVIFDSLPKSKNARIKFLNHFGVDLKEEDSNALYYETFKGFETTSHRIIYSITGAFLCFILIFMGFIKKNKSSLALIFDHYIVSVNVLKSIKRNNLKKVYFFNIYELESNIISKVFMGEGIEVVKIPSEVPISIWNRNILCDKLIICNGYQFDEITEFSDSIKFKSTKFWGPEKVFEYHEIYQDKSTEQYTLGFYSTASWVRKLEGHMDQGVDMVKGEEIVLKILSSLLAEDPRLHLMIYLHPKEKSDKYLEKSKQHYKSLLEDLKYDLMLKEKPGTYYFKEVDLAVAFNTTLMYERIYCGFKSILFPMNPKFPIEGTGMSNICPKTEEELKSKIKSSIEISTIEFFRINGIEKYASLN